VIDALLVRELPYRDPERIVLVFETDAANRRAIEGVAPANFLDWHPHVRSLESVSAIEPFGFTYTEGSEPQSMPGARVSRGFFEAFGAAAMYGRTFTSEKFTAGRNNVVVLSYGTWAQRFARPCSWSHCAIISPAICDRRSTCSAPQFFFFSGSRSPTRRT
jgi:hypothetical protein